ncbi:MFS transporter [Shewanella sp. AS16]|uniref:MFS transporter n=1 Tax=Shewanella sp. AS16 TaxID=2907625 RepID=UPI001F1FE308|nr:MFS transporter [Shewanella sp. AS16]MCE9685158.1 MFS transporter [Shewanella sp. AS16]
MRAEHQNMSHSGRIMLCLITTYVIFAMLLNSVGTVILQVISSFDVSKSGASVLEGFKDIPIALVSFLVASYLPRFGYKAALALGMSTVTLACALMPLLPGFLMTKLLFLAVGTSFALVKISTYSLLGQISATAKIHAANMNLLEGCFMLGVLGGYWLFGLFIQGEQHPQAWLTVYWVLAALALANLLLLLSTPIARETRSENSREDRGNFSKMLKLTTLPFVLTFVTAAFFYVLIEQGVGSWLPTFNNQVLHLSAGISVQITSIFAACLALGRLSAGLILRRVHWYPLLMGCIAAMASLLLLILPAVATLAPEAQITQWHQVPAAAFILPMLGMFMSPIYPAINSAVLSALPRHRHAPMTGLIVIFSALGGTLGSLITGLIFDHFDGQSAFYFMLLPMAVLALTLRGFKRQLTPAEPLLSA